MEWAIRDVKHGKTYHFKNWAEMVRFILGKEPKQ